MFLFLLALCLLAGPSGQSRSADSYVKNGEERSGREKFQLQKTFAPDLERRIDEPLHFDMIRSDVASLSVVGQTCNKIMGETPSISTEYYDFCSYISYKNVTIEQQECIQSEETWSSWMRRQARNSRYDSYARFVDKSAVKHFVRLKTTDVKLPKTLMLFTTKNLQFLWSYQFPDSFAFKATHGSGMNFLVRNNKTLQGKPFKRRDLYGLASQWLRKCYNCKSERQYSKIRPAVLVEEYLNTSTVIDYKVFVFAGEAIFIEVKENDLNGPKFRFYWRNWKSMASSVRPDLKPGKLMPPPAQLPKMLEVAGRLAEDFRFVRVDLYIVEGEIFVGELTFSPAGGSQNLNHLLSTFTSALGLCTEEAFTIGILPACPDRWTAVKQYDASADKISFTLWQYFFAGKCGGLYLEIGAYDGKTASNSLLFSQAMNWTGVLIEASPASFQLLQRNRPNDKVFHSAVCAETTKLHWSDKSTGSGIYEFLSPSYRKRFHGQVKETELPTVTCRPLSSILQDAGYTYFDFFTLDVEGSELQVLHTIDFSEVSFGVLVVEFNVHFQEIHAKIEGLLNAKGYVLIKRTKSGRLSEDGWFASAEFLAKHQLLQTSYQHVST
eukprot:scaffold1733_cov450-Pavlova_lutheri.AAC.1